ncbi:MAG TPA: HEAT repeat domain-containing protein [Gemmatimonadales bacterium]|nr:HEAT repeat domain-containing protein [Gemmatimonadales bacterium]
MNNRAWFSLPGALAALIMVSAAEAQSLERRVASAPDGTIRFSYAAKPGVYGDGRNRISWDCRDGNCRHNQIHDSDDGWQDDWDAPCDSGPVRIAMTKRSGRISDLRVYVGGEWRPGTGATDLGLVGTKEATSYLLDLASRDESRASDKAIFAAILADSVSVWPDLLKIAKQADVSRKVRRSAVFWLGQAAGDAATRGLTDLVDDGSADREVRETAVFALSQRPRDEGVPALIRIARQNPDPELRRKAIFWLGQSEDPRALSLFEELLTRP